MSAATRRSVRRVVRVVVMNTRYVALKFVASSSRSPLDVFLVLGFPLKVWRESIGAPTTDFQHDHERDEQREK